jgi:hypothetical protein
LIALSGLSLILAAPYAGDQQWEEVKMMLMRESTVIHCNRKRPKFSELSECIRKRRGEILIFIFILHRHFQLPLNHANVWL